MVPQHAKYKKYKHAGIVEVKSSSEKDLKMCVRTCVCTAAVACRAATLPCMPRRDACRRV